MTPTEANAVADAIDRVLEERRWQLRAKRAVDVLVSGALLILLSPLLALVAIAIRLETPGPVLFRQQRWGWREEKFWFYKFRSMRVGDDANVTAPSSDGRLRKAHGDRVTRVGRLIRRTSIDELPQLWNVLRGDMSLVGPRPLMLLMLDPFPELRRIRCKARPGLTGLWQVSAREHNTHVDAMTRWDLEYLLNVSMALDGRILVRTVGAVISGSGAV